MTESELIMALSELHGMKDPEQMHAMADRLLLMWLKEVHPCVYNAYEAVHDDAGAWWFA